MLLLLFHGVSGPGPDSDMWERYIRPEFGSTTLSTSVVDGNSTPRSLSASLGPTLPRLPLTNALQ